MGKLIKITNAIQKETYEKRKRYLRNKLIDYYNTINEGKVSIPSFILADNDIKRCEKEKTINKWYKRLKEA